MQHNSTQASTALSGLFLLVKFHFGAAHSCSSAASRAEPFSLAIDWQYVHQLLHTRTVQQSVQVQYSTATSTLYEYLYCSCFSYTDIQYYYSSILELLHIRAVGRFIFHQSVRASQLLCSHILLQPSTRRPPSQRLTDRQAGRQWWSWQIHPFYLRVRWPPAWWRKKEQSLL